MARLAHLILRRLEQIRQSTIGKTLALEVAHFVFADRIKRAFFNRQFKIDDLFNLRQKPRINRGVFKHLFNCHADAKRIGHIPKPIGCWVRQLFADFVDIH